MTKARILPHDDNAIAEAARLIAEGKPVAMPTETVYGLAADATRGDAVAAIYAAKGRPSFNPLIVHVLDRAAAEKIADLPDAARKLADAFWPGPLSLVLPKTDVVPDIVTAGGSTVAMRVPSNPVALALIRTARVPIAASAS